MGNLPVMKRDSFWQPIYRALSVVFLMATLGVSATAASAADSSDIEAAFDSAFAHSQPLSQSSGRRESVYSDPFQAQVARLASAEQGRIGVAAYDLTTGRSVSVLGDQPFPFASTIKVAIAATFLEQVDAGRLRLSNLYPLMVPVPSRKFDGPVAPVRAGDSYSAESLITMSLTHSNNQATDALLAAVGGPAAVNDWLRRTGNGNGVHIDRDIATLVRDDGAVNPVTTIDTRDSATPMAMVRMLTGLYQGRWLSSQSRNFLLDTMSRCETGKNRIRALMPEGTAIAHKTGTLSNTASDIGIISMPDGRAIALAVYVTGQGSKTNRDWRIAEIARTIYDGYLYAPAGASAASARK
jgi:beta-lactamase class A